MDRTPPAWARRRFTAADPDFAARMTVEPGADRALGLLKVELVDYGPGWVEMRMPFQRIATNETGIMHGGMVAFLADDAAGFAAYSLMPKGSSVVTVELKINYLAAVTGGWLVARSQVIRSGRSIAVIEVELAMDDGSGERDCAVALVTMMRVPETVGPRT